MNYHEIKAFGTLGATGSLVFIWKGYSKVFLLSHLLDTYTDSNSLFEGLWDEWFNLNVFLLARQMQLDDVLYEEIFDNLPKEKQSELIGKKADFAKKAGITP